MNVKLAKTAGFCFGVKRAVDTVYEQIEKQQGPIYTFGPIIHNEQVVGDLERRGVSVLNTIDDIDKISNGTVIIRSHGVSKKIYDHIISRGLNCIDSTCPFVKRIHNIVSRESENGSKIIIVGNAGHPEVEGIIGWCRNGADVIETEEEALKYCAPIGAKICIVSQTTFNSNKFQYIVEIIQKKGYNVSIVNTICNATQERQSEAKELASQADVMIVIGGRHSSNTRKLYEICVNECAHTFFIQTLDDLQLKELPKSVKLVGITAGASTPNNIIEEVQNYVRINF